MNSVFVLSHLHTMWDGEEDGKLLGVYSTPTNAEAAIKRYSMRPGFRDHLEGFVVDEYALDDDQWLEGFAEA